MDERALVKKLNRGSRSALDTAVERFTPYVSAVILRLLAGRACREDVEELCADVFVALWSHAHQLDPEQGLRPWLAAVARNKAIDRLRASPLPPLPLEAAEGAAGPGLDEEVEKRIFAAQLRSAVETLEPSDNTLILRFYFEGDRLRDIAADLGLSPSTAKVRLHRARQKLKQILMKGGPADGPNK